MSRCASIKLIDATLRCLAAAMLLAGCGDSGGGVATTPADAVYNNATVVTVDSSMSTAQAVAIRDGEIVAVGSNQQVAAFQGPATKITDLHGATVLPGFIDTHTHTLGWGFFADRASWLDVSNVNVLFKPLPGDFRCADPPDPQQCFIPVQTQDDVLARLRDAVGRTPNSDTPVLAFNYDPSRLGHSRDCPGDGLAFACPNFEDGHSREVLDQISITNPMLVASESGHIVYVNTVELRKLNICGTDGATSSCHMPITNPVQEEALAQMGQLNEDLALYAVGAAEGEVLQHDPLQGVVALQRAVDAYQQHGFTLVQEGAAAPFQMGIYALGSLDPDFPVTAAMLVYDSNTNDVSVEIDQAQRVQHLIADNPNMFIAGIKAFADGSTQGYTGYMSQQYSSYFFPFTDAVFPQPYVGLPDLDESALASAAMTAHAAGFPLAIHNNGDHAVADAVQALQAQTARGLRDIVIHFTLADATDISDVKALGAGPTFLMEDAYYYGLPMCQQVLGRERAAALYPAGEAVRAGLRFSLHSDTPVTPGDPLFAIWVAKTRATQQPPWYPNLDPTECPVVLSPNQSISIAQGIKAYTIDAAWIYGLDNQLGSIEVGKTADLDICNCQVLHS